MSARPNEFGGRREGLASYLDALREHWLLILALVAIAVGAAAAYSASATKRYESSADVLVSPLASGDQTFLGIPSLLREEGQGRAVLTAARLLSSPEIRNGVKRRLGTQNLGGTVQVTPLAQSNIVTVLGQSPSPVRAAELANAYARELLAQRTATFQKQLRTVISGLQGELDTIPENQQQFGAGAALAARLSQLTPLVGQPDPTLQVSSSAVVPDFPAWPRPVLSIAIAFVASLLLGLGLALALELVNPRVNREEELLLDQRLPILARVPRMPRRVIRRYLTGRAPLPGGVREAYRTLRARLTSGRDGGLPGSILITSASPGEGKTMTSVNLAIGLATTGTRVILVDGDLRRPMVATLFGVPARNRGLADLITGESRLDDLLTPAPGHGDVLRLLLASPEHAHVVDLLDPSRVSRALAELRSAADVVVIDSPPLTEVADALTLADDVDAIVLAVRLGRTRRDRLNELRRILAQRGVSPVGFVVTTRKGVRGGYYYGTADTEKPPPPRTLDPPRREPRNVRRRPPVRRQPRSDEL